MMHYLKAPSASTVDARAARKAKIGTSAAVTLALLGLASPARALLITPTFDSSITKLADASAVEATINQAIHNIDSYIANPVDVSIQFSDVNTGLGASSTQQADLNYSAYKSDLLSHVQSNAHTTSAFGTLPAGPGTGINGATQVFLTSADLNALGETSIASGLKSSNGGFDSMVSLNISATNVSRTGSQDPNNYDLQSVAAHEIDEVLGIGGNGSQLFEPDATPPASLPTDVGPLDFFRYSTRGDRSFTYDSNSTAYFSIDGGKSAIVNFNQLGAGGSDFGDWGDGTPDGTGNVPEQVQDAFGTPGGQANLGPSELTALNVIGWNLTPAGLKADGISAVPLPAAVWSGLGMLAVLGTASTLRRRASAV